MVNDGIVTRKFLDDEKGISWGLASVFMLMVFGGAMILFFAPIMNGLINPFNTYISMDMVSQDTADAVNFGVNVWLFYPVVAIFALFAWIVVRAHDRGDY